MKRRLLSAHSAYNLQEKRLYFNTDLKSHEQREVFNHTHNLAYCVQLQTAIETAIKLHQQPELNK